MDVSYCSDFLFLQAKKQLDEHIIEEDFFGQEINHITYNLASMNMFLHNINYDKFYIELGDTLIAPNIKDDKLFDTIMSKFSYCFMKTVDLTSLDMGLEGRV